jgi:hypothetical protein
MAKTESVTRRGFFGLLGAAAIAPKELIPKVYMDNPVHYEMVRVPVHICGGHHGKFTPDGGDLGLGSGPITTYRWEKRLKAGR